MARRDEFDDESFFESLLNRKGNAELPDGLRRIFIVIGVLVLVSIVIAVVVASWPERQQVDETSVPIIRADSNPYKVKPQDPGGMKVPNKDSTIFETLKGDVPEPKTENLLEDESANVEPVERPEAKPADLGAVPDVKSADVENLKPEATPPQPVAPKVETATAKKVVEEEEAVDEKALPSVIETLKADNKPKEEKLVVKAEPKPAAKPVSTGGSTYIQLAAVKSEAEAQSQWSKFKAKNPELGSLSMRTQKADLGAKGIFYRIQAGPLTADNATKTCAAVKSRGGSCIIAK